MLRKSIGLAAAVAAGAVFVILDVILGVTLWVSLLVAGSVLIAGGIAQIAGLKGTEGVQLNPVVDVRALRARFVAVITLGLAATFLIVASFAFAPATVAVLGWAVGIAATLVSLSLSPTLRRASARQRIAIPALGLRVAAWDAIAVLSIAISGWQIVQAFVFGAGTARWLTFANACGLAGLTLGALVLHELSTERVVHALELVEQSPAEERERAAA